MTTTMTERATRPRATVRTTDGDRREYRAALHTVVELATAAAGAGLDELLREIVVRAADVVGVRRAAVYLRRERSDVFEGRAAHPAGELEHAVRHLLVGGPTDPFTREIAETRAPVLVRDAATDPRAAQTALRNWKVRAVLGVPLVHGGDVVGVLFLDNAERPHPWSTAHVDVASAIGRLAGALVGQAAEADAARRRADTAARQNRLLRSATIADNRFSQVIIGGGGLRSIVGVLGELTGKPVAAYDADLRRVACCAAEGEPDVRLGEHAAASAEVASALRDAPAGASTVIGPLLAADVRRRHLVAPVDLGERRWGWVVALEHPGRLSAFDELLVRRAAKYAGLELAAERRAETAAWDARSLLARQLIRGTQDEDVRRSADHLGIDLDRPRLVAFACGADGSGASLDAERLVAALAEEAGGEVLATKGPEGVAVLVEVPAEEAPVLAVRRTKELLARALAGLGTGERLVAGVSAVCREPQGVPRAYREAREVARCVDHFAGAASERVLAADDLGPGRLFVANGEPGSIERFVDDVVGPLLTGADGMADLLRTLQTFFDTGRSVRLSAARLGIHENTVRYRLARVGSLTGLDVAADADDQLTVQMSLLVLRLKGHPALPAFGEPAA